MSCGNLNQKVIKRMALAILSLILGGLVYLFMRPPIYPFIGEIQEMLGISNFNDYKTFTGSIPTLCHTFTFTILTANFLPETPAIYALNSFGWICLESIFELMQNDSFLENKITKVITEFMLCNENCRGYFLLGTYDEIDVLSIIIGGILAYFFLMRLAEDHV